MKDIWSPHHAMKVHLHIWAVQKKRLEHLEVCHRIVGALLDRHDRDRVPLSNQSWLQAHCVTLLAGQELRLLHRHCWAGAPKRLGVHLAGALRSLSGVQTHWALHAEE